MDFAWLELISKSVAAEVTRRRFKTVRKLRLLTLAAACILEYSLSALFRPVKMGTLLSCAPFVAVRALPFFGGWRASAREVCSFFKRSQRNAPRPEQVII